MILEHRGYEKAYLERAFWGSGCRQTLDFRTVSYLAKDRETLEHAVDDFWEDLENELENAVVHSKITPEVFWRIEPTIEPFGSWFRLWLRIATYPILSREFWENWEKFEGEVPRTLPL